MKKLLRTKSHRLPLKRKYNIQKKMREARRKLKRELRKHPEKKRVKRGSKNFTVPNACPFKEQVLLEMEDQKKQKESEQEAKREELKQRRLAAKEAKLLEKRGNTDLATLVKDAENRDSEFEMKSQTSPADDAYASKDKVQDTSAKAYFKEFLKVVEAADVILEVLDARDPIGTRCTAVEEAVVNAGPNKRLVLVLNKADLVPKDNLKDWLKALRNELPAVAFKASTQIQSARLGRGKKNFLSSDQADVTTSKCLGADTLMKLLGNYARNKGIKTAIRVGVVGLPNVGKSSIINSLKRSKACNVGAVPGVTKTMQEVALDSKIMLLDSPGMVLASEEASDSTVALRNAIRIDALDDPIKPVEVVLNRTGKEYMMMQYGLGDFGTVQEFLCLLAKRMGKMLKGAIPDVNAAARRILHDWNTGKIKYFTCPPETDTETHVGAAIVSQLAKEFSLDDVDFQQMETEDIDQLPQVKPSATIALESAGAVTQVSMATHDGDEAVESMEAEVDDKSQENKVEKKVRIKAPEGKKKKTGETGRTVAKKDPESLLPGNQRHKKLAKIQEKKARKDRARRERLGESLSNELESAFSGLGGK